MVSKIKRIASTSSRRIISLKWVPLFVIVSWLARSIIVIIYCSLLHGIIFRWTSCPTENHWPKNFSNLDTLKFDKEPTACGILEKDGKSKSLSIVIFVPIHISKFDRRNTIRNTWARLFRDRVEIDGWKLHSKFIFLVASISSSPDRIDQQLTVEHETHGDILQVSNVIDDYYNITLKIRAVLKWTSEKCPGVSYVIRADSDIVLEYANLLHFLNYLNRIRWNGHLGDTFVVGYCRPFDCVTRWPTSKTCLPWSVYNELSSYFLPRYCFGFSYILSNGYVKKTIKLWNDYETKLLNMDGKNIIRRYWPLDDIYLTGYTAEELGKNIPRLNYPGIFNYQIKFDQLSCIESGVVASSAYSDNEEMERKWKNRLERCRFS